MAPDRRRGGVSTVEREWVSNISDNDSSRSYFDLELRSDSVGKPGRVIALTQRLTDMRQPGIPIKGSIITKQAMPKPQTM